MMTPRTMRSLERCATPTYNMCTRSLSCWETSRRARRRKTRRRLRGIGNRVGHCVAHKGGVRCDPHTSARTRSSWLDPEQMVPSFDLAADDQDTESAAVRDRQRCSCCCLQRTGNAVQGVADRRTRQSYLRGSTPPTPCARSESLFIILLMIISIFTSKYLRGAKESQLRWKRLARRSTVLIWAKRWDRQNPLTVFPPRRKASTVEMVRRH